MAVVMFDFDGVIADSLDQFVADFTEACRENGFEGVKSREDVLALFEGNVYNCLEEKGLDEITVANILGSYKDKAEQHLANIGLFSGMKKVLIEIAQKHHLYIITSNHSKVPIQVLSRNGVEVGESVKEVLGAEKEKSKIRKIKATMEKFPQLAAFYVGDTVGDILEGQEAGVKTVGVTWGWHGSEKLTQVSPDYMVDTPAQLATLFCELK